MPRQNMLSKILQLKKGKTGTIADLSRIGKKIVAKLYGYMYSKVMKTFVQTFFSKKNGKKVMRRTEMRRALLASAPQKMKEETSMMFGKKVLALLGAALVFGERDHMNLSLLTDKLKGKPKYVLEIATELVIAGICYVILLKGGMTFMNIGKL